MGRVSSKAAAIEAQPPPMIATSMGFLDPNWRLISLLQDVSPQPVAGVFAHVTRFFRAGKLQSPGREWREPASAGILLWVRSKFEAN
jgi:hypothetical protein